MSDINGDSIDVNEFIESFNNGEAYGRVKLFKADDATKFWFGEVTSVTDNTTDFTLGVSYIDSNLAFSLSDDVVLSFTGSGQDNIISLHNDFTTDSTSIATPALVKSFTLLRNTLNKVGDGLLIRTSAVKLMDHAGSLNIKLGVGGISLPALWSFPLLSMRAAIRIEVFYETNLIFYYRLRIDYTDAAGASTGSLTLFSSKGLIGEDFTQDHLDIAVYATTDGVETTNIEDFQVTKIQ